MKKFQIAMVDDDSDDLEIIEEAITEVGWEVLFIPFYCGHDLLNAITGDEEFRPDLIILEYNLPGFNGAEIIKKLNEKMCLGCTIVVFSSDVSPGIKEHLGSMGAHCCLTKPNSFHECIMIAEGLRCVLEDHDWSRLETA